MGDVDWTPGLIALLMGVVAGFFLALRQTDGKPGVDIQAGRLEDLRREKQRLFAALADLEDTDEATGVAIASRERLELEMRAAEVVRFIEQAERDEAAPSSPERSATGDAPATAAASGLSPELRGMLKGGLAVAFVAALGLALWRGTLERKEGMGLTGAQPETVTMERQTPLPQPGQPGGAVADVPPELAPKTSARVDRARALVAADPDELAGWVELGYALVEAEGLIDAYSASEEILKRSPGHADGLSIQGVVRVAMGQAGTADELFAAALEANPEQVIALSYRGMLAYEGGDAAGARAYWAKARDLTEGTDREGFTQLIGMVDSGTPLPGRSPRASGHPGGDHPPVESPPVAGEGISGTVRVADGFEAPSGAVLFIIGRHPGVQGGPPAATRKLLTSSFPATFSLGPGDVMMGGPFPEKIALSARLDTDGNAFTQSEGDLVGTVGVVGAGASGVEIVLARP